MGSLAVWTAPCKPSEGIAKDWALLVEYALSLARLLGIAARIRPRWANEEVHKRGSDWLLPFGEQALEATRGESNQL